MSMAKITHIVVHYSATYSDLDYGVAEIDAMHKARGWKMVGYHYIIRRDGRVEKGRPDNMVGAHVGGQNSGKLGICWIGGTERATGPNKGVDNRTPRQTEALVNLIRQLLQKHRGAKVVGHRDLAATQCPGFDVPSWWARVQKKKAPEPTPPSPDAPAKTPGVNESDATYTVRSGDTLSMICTRLGVSWQAIAVKNGIGPPFVIRPGQVLRIPASEKAASTPPPVPAPSPAPEPPRVPVALPEPSGGFWARLWRALFGV